MRSRSLSFALALVILAPTAARGQVAVVVDAAASRRLIDPNVYGVAHAELTDLNVPPNRYGGNNTSRTNWQQNADNRGADWYFESVPAASATPGEVGDTFIATGLRVVP